MTIETRIRNVRTVGYGIVSSRGGDDTVLPGGPFGGGETGIGLPAGVEGH